MESREEGRGGGRGGGGEEEREERERRRGRKREGLEKEGEERNRTKLETSVFLFGTLATDFTIKKPLSDVPKVRLSLVFIKMHPKDMAVQCTPIPCVPCQYPIPCVSCQYPIPCFSASIP